ncbi:MAG: pilus assembly protein PilP [Thiohalospira sp.]
MTRWSSIGPIAAIGILMGCSDPDLEGLQARMESAEGESANEVAPLPTLTEPEFPDFAANGRNPVRSPEGTSTGAKEEAAGPAPEPGREPGPLEAHSLESLRLVGVLGACERRIALVEGPDGRLHQVSVGDYMGRNHGRVERITAGAVELRELVRDGSAWEERTARLQRDREGES